MHGAMSIIITVLLISLAALGVAIYFAKWVLSKDDGTPEMRKVSDAIKAGAEAFLHRQYQTIAIFATAVAVLIAVGYYMAKGTDVAIQMTVSYIAGALCSGIAGYVGMWVSIRSNIRTASAARTSLDAALRIALRGGAVSGLFVVAMSLLGVGLLFLCFGGASDEAAAKVIPLNIIGFGFGASFVALFAQLGGGIYTKAADVGADLVGKVEAGIPEDDPRNPAVIADLVGDNVGDCAGRGADLFESTAAENIGAMILGIALFPAFGVKGILFALLARAFGLIASIIGIWGVKVKDNEDPMKALNRGYLVTTIFAVIGFALACYMMFDPKVAEGAWWKLFLCGVTGIITSFIFVFITQYYTEYTYRPVKSIAESCKTGPATTIISGFSVGLESVFYPTIVICAAILISYWLGSNALATFKDAQGNAVNGGLYGTAVATMGMLATAAYILAMDTFGPITDNAGGIVEMSQQPEEIRDRTDRLDSVGNTTKALTKGYAVGSAALAAFLLFSSYLDEVFYYVKENGSTLTDAMVRDIDIGKPAIFVGGFLGAMLVFLFTALAIRAVGHAAQTVIQEVRRQFRENPGIMEGTSDPDYGQCVDIVTKGALKAMIAPAILPIIFPLVVGVLIRLLYSGNTTDPLAPIMGAQAVAALLMIATIAGILLALTLNNGGGAWDNAKKYVETGFGGGKNSDVHRAAVVGDTVGDPFKDTAGPSLHVLIKLLSTLTLVMAPLFIGK